MFKKIYGKEDNFDTAAYLLDIAIKHNWYHQKLFLEITQNTLLSYRFIQFLCMVFLGSFIPLISHYSAFAHGTPIIFFH